MADRVAESKQTLARIATLQGRLAELRQRYVVLGQEEAEIHAELARLYSGQAGSEQPIDLRTRAKARPPTRAPLGRPVPLELVPTDVDSAKAARILRRNEHRRRTAR